MDLAFQPPVGNAPQRDLAEIRDLADLPPYIAEAVQAVAQGVQTSHEFAVLRGISITNASERFRMARKLGWIIPAIEQVLPRQGICYILSPSRHAS